MKKIIPFKKNLDFKTNVSEITSISLENTLQNKGSTVDGDLIVSGNYKIVDTSINVDSFEFKIPVNIEIDGKYITDDMVIDIDDFYYEIINNNVLEINVDVLLDNLVEVSNDLDDGVFDFELVNDLREEISMVDNSLNFGDDVIDDVKEVSDSLLEDRCIEEETGDVSLIQNIFDNVDGDEVYSTYYVYIVREGDSIEQILTKYNTSREVLSLYNDLSEIKLGDKIIIPA